MDPALRQQLDAARRELDALLHTVRRAATPEAIAAAIARRDAAVMAERRGQGVTVRDLARLEVVGEAAASSTARPEAVSSRAVGPATRNDGAVDHPEAVVTDSASIAAIVVAGAADRFHGGRTRPTGEGAAVAWLTEALLRTSGDTTPAGAASWSEGPSDPAPDREGATAFIHAVAEAAVRTRALAEHLIALAATDRRRIEALGKAAASSVRVHGVLQRWPVASIDRVVRASGLQVQAATSALHRLRGLDIIRENARHRGRRVYSYDAYLAVIADDVAEWVRDATAARATGAASAAAPGH